MSSIFHSAISIKSLGDIKVLLLKETTVLFVAKWLSEPSISLSKYNTLEVTLKSIPLAVRELVNSPICPLVNYYPSLREEKLFNFTSQYNLRCLGSNFI
jgi:hypothetical protein